MLDIAFVEARLNNRLDAARLPINASDPGQPETSFLDGDAAGFGQQSLGVAYAHDRQIDEQSDALPP